MIKFDLTAVPIGTLKITRGATIHAPLRSGDADPRLSATTYMATRLREQHRDIATAVFWKRRIGEAERCTWFHQRTLRGDNRSPHTSNARLCTHPGQGPDEITWPRQGRPAGNRHWWKAEVTVNNIANAAEAVPHFI